MIHKFINIIEIDNRKEAEKNVGLLKKEGTKPVVAIINTNRSDEPSMRYIKNKCRELEEAGIGHHVYYADDDGELCDKIFLANSDTLITSIIVQAPFGPGITMSQQEVFDMVEIHKDVDRLHSCWYYHKDYNNLPLTACGIYKLIKQISGCEKMNVLFYGNGLTTNRRLFLHMFDEGAHDCRIVNSKTPRPSVESLVEWADIIVAASGKAESLRCKGKIVISPTIIKTAAGFRGDIDEDFREFNKTHGVLGNIGKLTVSELLKRVAKDAVLQDPELLMKDIFRN